ncbi:(2Fe-2S)-binding protein [Sulfurimonas sp. MAG313]|nr:2Fe-2S iron-sulfur cluster-binding protein [Sulfurimonas sp. MAG313]MDF1881323.1 (2Fe-2S)-binding protein [Sulfurimonas sp. MAG313]
MSKRVSITVDDKRLQVEEGALLLPTLLKHGIMVPHFCYHESLGPDGNCRMCMVGIEGQKRPQIACDTPIKKDMVVYTKNEAINDVKRKILEFELLSHPVDCPICDQAGECSLQDYYMEFGLNEARRPKEEKKHKNKKLDIGKNIILDQERCVLCARCTRFTQEITHTNELSIIGRGNDARVSPLPGEKMHTPYAMNIIDLCPVGALTSKDFRFKQRVWFMHTAKSVCHSCAKGCNIYIDHNQEKYKSDTIFRYRPRINEAVNGHFICDEGRLSYKNENKERIQDYYQKNKIISEDIALSHLLHCLAHLHPVLIVSPSLSLEELTIIQVLSRKFGLYVHAYADGYKDESFADDWLRCADTSANLAGVKKFDIDTSKDSFIKALECTSLIINFSHQSFLDTHEKDQALLVHKKEIHLTSHCFTNYKHKELIIPISSYTEKEGSIINEDGILQRFEAGLCNEKKSLLEVLNLLIQTPSSPQGVWNEHLSEVFGFAYDDIPALGRSV